VESYVGCILVEDASGCRFRLYEYRHRRFLSWKRYFILDDGEPVRRLDSDHYEVAATEEILLRVEGDRFKMSKRWWSGALGIEAAEA